MAGKYISIDHAATRLSMSVDDLNKIRERGDIRAFSDRGTWKFRVEDIEEIARQRQTDSDADFEIFLDDIIESETKGSAPIKDPDSDSDVKLVSGQSSTDGGNQMVTESGSRFRLGPQDKNKITQNKNLESDIQLKDSSFEWGGMSDSDVRLVGSDDSKSDEIDADSDIALSDSSMSMRVTDSMVASFEQFKSDSDSDVQLVEEGKEPHSDSDVKLVKDSSSKHSGMNSPYSSGIQLVDEHGSDSDVKLIPESGKSGSSFSLGSDIRFADDDGSDVRLLSNIEESGADSDSDVQLVPDPSMPGESGLSLTPLGDSGLTLEGPNDSEVSILSDEGSQLYGGSGITLASDSGISLELAADSGISLSGHDDDEDGGITLAGDSGITLTPKSSSGFSLGGKSGSGSKKKKPAKSGKDDSGATIPMLDIESVNNPSGDNTAFDFDLEEEESYSLSGGGNDNDVTKVIMFDEDGDSSELEAPTLMRGAKNKPVVEEDSSEDSVFDLGTIDEEESEDLFDDDELEISDDVLGEDDEVDDLDIMDSSSDESFSDEFESGSSEPEYAGHVARGSVVVEPEWGIVSFLLVVTCTLFMIPATLVMFELVHSMWSFNQPFPPSNMVLDTLAGFYKS
jgi:hypothetical protein